MEMETPNPGPRLLQCLSLKWTLNSSSGWEGNHTNLQRCEPTVLEEEQTSKGNVTEDRSVL